MADNVSSDNIEKIDDFMAGMDILEQHELIMDGINDVDDVKEILRLKYHPKKYDDTLNARKGLLYNNYSTLKSQLKEQLKNVKDFIKLPLFQREFGSIYKISKERIMDKQNKLDELIERNSFPILTAGEAKAGKSTLINLLLGENLMPMDLVTCTRMICEVRNSDKKKATFFLDDKDPNPKTIPLDGDLGAISKFVKQEHDVNYKKGIFEYPVDFLDEFTYLVDSPGIGDTTPLEKITFDFLNENAPAFIFVLNATNSNGLNIKAKELISKAKTELTKDSCCFITDESKPNKYNIHELDKAIFILNHWDIVRSNAKSKDEVEQVRSTIIKEIQSLWSESAEEGVQIFFMSALQARQWKEKGLVQTELIKLRQSLTNLVVKLYERNFENSLKLLSDILDYIESKIIQKINTHVDNKYCRLYNKGHAEQLCSILETIIINTQDRKKKITDALKPKFVAMAKSLTEHLKSDEVETRILEKAQSKILIEKNIDFLTIVLKKILENQLYEELKFWEKETNQIEHLNSYLNSLFENHLVEISNQININNMLINKESLLNAWNSSNHKEMKKLDGELITKIEQVFIITTITLLFPVVALAGLLATPLIVSYMIKEKRSNAESLKKYEEDKEGYLRKIIKESLINLSENDVRRCFFKNLTDRCVEHIRAFDVFISAELSEKRQLIKDIENENREMPEILRSLNTLLSKIELRYGDYHLLQIKYLPDESLIVRSAAYLKGNETEPPQDEIISLGKKSIVFRSGRYSNVVFKMYTKPFSQQFARYQMQELDILSTSPYRYILHLKNVCILEKKNQLLLVMENVHCNLQTYLNNNRDLVPLYQYQKSQNWDKAFSFVINVSKQLCSCLNYLHEYERRMVHPDLRIETVLVHILDNEKGVNIFISDACTNLPTQRYQKKSGNSQSQIIENVFDMGGYTKENIYRLGIIFYKMAYFEFENASSPSSTLLDDPYDDTGDNDFLSIESMESDINIDWSHKKHLNIPHAYNDLIKICIAKHPQHRLSASVCLERLESLNLSE